MISSSEPGCPPDPASHPDARSGADPGDQATVGEHGRFPRTAVFVAGDKNIFFPAVVAIRSMEVHNPGRFDFFLSFDEADLTVRMREIISGYGINFVSSKGIERADRAFGLKKMNGFWPAEVFLNWLMPEYLHGLGYPYSIKIDYDILCVRTYDDILAYWPWNVAYSAVHVNAKSWPDKTVARSNKDFRLKQAKPMYSNAGFIIFNNAICRSEGLYDKFESANNALIETAPNVGLREQAALAMVSAAMPGGIGKVPSHYNHRIPRYRRESAEDPALVNIHYIGARKPWHDLDQAGVEALVRRGRAIAPFFSPIWLEFASSVDGFSEYCQLRPYTAMQMLGLARDVINESERLIRQHRREANLLRDRLKELGDESGVAAIAERISGDRLDEDDGSGE